MQTTGFVGERERRWWDERMGGAGGRVVENSDVMKEPVGCSVSAYKYAIENVTQLKYLQVYV